MKQVPSGRRTILLVCDAAPEVGVGHAIRCLALAEEFLSRSLAVAHVGRMQVPWVEQEYRERGVDLLGPQPPVEAAAQAAVAAVVIDSYTLPPATSDGLARLGRLILAVVDGTTRGLAADLYLDQGLGATPETLGVDSRNSLCGPRFALLRDIIRDSRAGAWHEAGATAAQRVSVAFGGTDPASGAVEIARTLARTGVPIHVTIMAASPAHAAELAAVEWAPGEFARIAAPGPGFLGSLAEADLVISASGSTVFELMALGRPMAVCRAADNQADNYGQLLGRELALGLGPVADLASNAERNVEALQELLHADDRRAQMAAAGASIIDGFGRTRVVDRMLGAGGSGRMA